jgi:hypothetical protein
MPLGHNKGTELPTLRERLLARRSDDAFIGASMLFNPDGPAAAAMLQTAAEALQLVRDAIRHEPFFDADPGLQDAARAADAALERLNR